MLPNTTKHKKIQPNKIHHLKTNKQTHNFSCDKKNTRPIMQDVPSKHDNCSLQLKVLFMADTVRGNLMDCGNIKPGTLKILPYTAIKGGNIMASLSI